uniref:Ddb1 and cul4 associated factor 17 n=1 Tax=Eptatretus burgeri TaxID=7764 RepID=A0A8C4N3R2_EPTBU
MTPECSTRASLTTQGLGAWRCFAPGRRPTRRSVCTLLKFRALGVGGCTPGEVQRFNLCLLREMVCLESNTFKRVWVKNSKTPVSYGRGRVYFDNYSLCYSCHGASPKLLYKLPAHAAFEKIEDALFCETPVVSWFLPPSDYRPSIVGLTSSNFLLRFNADTGQLLEKIFLSNLYKHISWISEQETLMLKSIRCKSTDRPRTVGANLTRRILLQLAFFTVFPLKLIGMMEIDQQIFGSTVTDVTVSEDILITLHSNGTVKFYNLEEIVNKASIIFFFFFLFHFPLFIGVNSQPIFFLILLEVGEMKAVAHGGVLSMDGCFLEDDWVMFHPDHSSRICQLNKMPDILCALQTIQLVDYEDELDLIIVAVVSDAESSGDAVIHLHDNSTGQRLKSIPLQGPWDVVRSSLHAFSLTRDTIIHMAQSVNRRTICQVYKLTKTFKESLPRISSQPPRRVKMRLDNG